ncbi:response regulator, partial [Rhizobium sullae]|uniref:response regulator n=1 Tax=Rhizobium sullae TaxID=50338 RepID=UPI00117A2B70
DGMSAVTLSESLRPDIALLDIRMGSVDGLEAAAEIGVRSPETRIIMLTMHDNVTSPKALKGHVLYPFGE